MAEESAYRLVAERPFARLRCYAQGRAGAPPLLILPAPIKRSYIWDLSPERSVVQRAVAHGLGVYLLEWRDMRACPFQPALADYVGNILTDCVDVLTTIAGAQKVILAGHSLGGILGALYPGPLGRRFCTRGQ